jgi:hypothetical protein
MWKWFNCYLSGRHDFGMWCEPGAIFLRCIHCGKRSSGWIVDSRANAHEPHVHSHAPRAAASLVEVVRTTSRVLPFDRVRRALNA